MKKAIAGFSVFLTMTVGFVSSSRGQAKLAQTGFDFLTVISDARAAALGGAVTALDAQSEALFFNPASMGFDKSFANVSLSLNNWIADIDHYAGSFSIRPNHGLFGEFGVSVQYVSYGTVEETQFAPNQQGYVDIGTYKPYAAAVGVGYAKQISDQFSVGGQVKLVTQDLGLSQGVVGVGDTSNSVSNKLSVVAFDFGTLFKTGFKSFTFGMSVRNFAAQQKYVQEKFVLPLRFTIGASMDLFDVVPFDRKGQSLLFSVDDINDRSHPEQVSFGLDYTLLQILSLRGGYISGNDENHFDFGLGVRAFGVRFDYAYSPYGIFGNINRFTLRFEY